MFTSCECCPMCYATAYWAHVSKIYHAASWTDYVDLFDDLNISTDMQRPYGQRTVDIAQIMQSDARKVWLEYRNLPQKTHALQRRRLAGLLPDYPVPRPVLLVTARPSRPSGPQQSRWQGARTRKGRPAGRGSVTVRPGAQPARNPVLCSLQVREGGGHRHVKSAEAMLQEPMSLRFVPLGQSHQHGDQAIASENQTPVLVRCVRAEAYRRSCECLDQRHF